MDRNTISLNDDGSISLLSESKQDKVTELKKHISLLFEDINEFSNTFKVVSGALEDRLKESEIIRAYNLSCQLYPMFEERRRQFEISTLQITLDDKKRQMEVLSKELNSLNSIIQQQEKILFQIEQ